MARHDEALVGAAGGGGGGGGVSLPPHLLFRVATDSAHLRLPAASALMPKLTIQGYVDVSRVAFRPGGQAATRLTST